jgi:magnesium transporter
MSAPAGESLSDVEVKPLTLVPDGQLDTAAALVCRNVPRFEPHTLLAEIRRSLRSTAYESVEDVAVCVGDQLLGLMRIEDVLTAPKDALASDIMDPDPPVVMPGVDQEVAAWKAVQRSEISLAVVDAEGRFVGLIPPWRMLSVLLQEHDEDVARISGFLSTASSALAASGESVPRRFWHRMPWLALGLAGSVGAATIVGGFEQTLSENIMLAFFLPGIVYMADAVGTQTEAIVIRGLSVGVAIDRVIRRELVTGVLVGVALAVLFLPTVLLGWGNVDIAVAVSLSLFAACSTATAIALFVPWLLNRLGKDPAFGSGPLATVLQDLISIGIYFMIASAMVH